MRRIPEFEALRGLLALWVVVGHAIKHAGFTDAQLGPLKPLANPGLAVDVFIVLSGFVIFNLLDRQGGAYLSFIVQRFFRLFPLYLAALLASAALLDFQSAVSSAMPWQTPFTETDQAIQDASIAELPAQLAVHLTMLHGLVPNWLLPFSEYGILGQAWSISVEWQFYLLAPLLFGLISRRVLAAICVLLALMLLRSRVLLGEGFAVNQAGYFLIGILSYFLWRRLRAVAGLDPRRVWLGGTAAAALCYFLLPRAISPMLWVLAMTVVIEAQCATGGITTAAIRLLRGPVLQWLGRISYSVYLTHMLVLYAVAGALLRFAPPALLESQWRFLAVLLPAGIAGTLLLSSLTYALIERPGIDLGHRLGAVLRAREARRVAV